MNKIEMVGIDELHEYPLNPRKIGPNELRELADSLRNTPALFNARPILASNRTGVLVVIGGDKRWKAARSLGYKDVPVIVMDGLTELQEREVCIKDNGHWGTWDTTVLTASWGDAPVVEWGAPPVVEWGKPDKKIVDTEPDFDKSSELEYKWKTQIGQTWKLGTHKLICDDCYSIKHGDIGLLFYDPPWDLDIDINTDTRPALVFTDARRCSDSITKFGPPSWVFVWDCITSWYTPNRPLQRLKLCLFYGDITKYNFNGAHYGDAGEERTVKNTRGAYEFNPDPRGKHLSDIFPCQITKLHNESAHKHSKPLDWVRMLIGNCSDGVVFDPFCGSGTTVIACEQLGRECVAVEIEPKNVAVILQRWLDTTGVQPVLVA
jgi:hypothetical protein